MSHAWFARNPTGNSWASRTGAASTAGVINGSADVSDSVEIDYVLVWQVESSVDADLSLLWQLDASPITSVEASIQLTWQILVDAPTYVDVDFYMLWNRENPTVVVPDVANISEHAARALIQSYGSLTTIVENTTDHFVAKGDVISIAPPAGTTVLYDAVVTMYVSLGWATSEDAGQGRTVYWQRPRKKLALKQQPNKHLKKLLDDEGKKVLARRAKKKTVKVEPIKLWP